MFSSDWSGSETSGTRSGGGRRSLRMSGRASDREY